MKRGFLIILIILIILTFIQKNNKIISSNYVNPGKVCVLLTTCTITKSINGIGNEEERIKMYNEVINNYLNKTSINIYIVNSSGYTFPEFKNNPRIFIYSYIQENKYLRYPVSYHEATSILKAFDYLNLNKFEYIIKITGRYFIPNINDIISKIPLGTELIFQNKDNSFILTFYQNSEIFGCKSSLLKNIMKTIINNNYISFEQIITLLSFKYKYTKINKIKLNNSVKKGSETKIMFEL